MTWQKIQKKTKENKKHHHILRGLKAHIDLLRYDFP
jgi:hypothetical protein